MKIKNALLEKLSLNREAVVLDKRNKRLMRVVRLDL